MSEQKREQWSSKMGFILAAVGSAVGLGNIWRYPYLLYSNGGGAFLIPYFIAIFTAGIPLLLLEYSLGHKFRGSTPLSFARANKKWEWLGWWPSITSFIILTYYTLILSWAMNYIFLSFGQAWGSDTNAFFFNEFLKVSSGPFSFGGIRWSIFFGITAVWFINWFVCYRGISGGIEKFSKILLPTLIGILVIITIRGVTLPGAALGLNKLFTPDWSKVMDPKVWIDAYGQVFFSLSLGMAIMVTYSSYLPKKSDINNSAFMTAFANCGFEFFAAIGIFGILGFMANSQGVAVEDVATESIGLAFIVFPKVFSIMGPVGTVFGVLFFVCLVFAGLTSCVSLTEAFSAAVMDKTGIARKKIVTIVVLAGYVLSCFYATGAGLYFLDIVDAFINSYSLVVVGLLEAIIFGWFFGTHIIRKHTNAVSLFSIGKWWDIMIKVVTPLVLTYMLVQSIIREINTPYGGGDYSVLALLIFGWGVIAVIIISSLVMSKTPWRHKIEVNTKEVE